MNAPPTTADATHPAREQSDVVLEVLSKPMYLCAVRDFLRQICKRLNFHDDQGAQIVLAVDEALANVMKHGYAGKPDGRITLALALFAQSPRGPGLKIIIEDLAPQVDLATIKSRDLAEVRPGGLGVHIIKNVMDEAVYANRTDAGGLGMRLTLVKYLSSPAVTGDNLAGTQPDSRCCGGIHG
jgi:serine/threonine-protein kinase RsbW